MSVAISLTVFGMLGMVGAGQVATQGPDLAGIALIITAVTGLIGTVGALVLGFRRKNGDAADVALRLILEREADRLKGDE